VATGEVRYRDWAEARAGRLLARVEAETFFTSVRRLQRLGLPSGELLRPLERQREMRTALAASLAWIWSTGEFQ
jgi:hypothetical protein